MSSTTTERGLIAAWISRSRIPRVQMSMSPFLLALLFAGIVSVVSYTSMSMRHEQGDRLSRTQQPPYDDTHSSVPTSVEAQDGFLDLLTATGCEVAVDANASEPSFLQYSKRTDVVRGRSGVQWTFGSLGKKNL